MPAPKRELLLQTAEAIFSKEGFKGVSVDRVLAEAGVAKMTLYKGFKSKNDLICETLRRRGDRLAAHLETYVDAAGPRTEDQILSCFDGMQDWSERSDFNGCYFVNALTEYGGSQNEIGEIARQYKKRFLDHLYSLCLPLDLAQPDSLPRSLFLLIEGATVTHISLGDKEGYARAKTIAAQLLT
jgi:AcrR family transcriptional regulator